MAFKIHFLIYIHAGSDTAPNTQAAQSPARYAPFLDSTMEPIEFSNQENPDYEAQLNYLIRREFYVTYHKIRKFPYYLIGITLFFFGIIIFTPSNSLITLKVISISMLSLAWVFTILFVIPILFKWYKRYKWKKDSLAFAKRGGVSYKLSFDKEKISFETQTYKTEFSWDYYTYWTENKNSIYIFSKSNLYEALYYSELDLGAENYLELKKIASDKLTRLD